MDREFADSYMRFHYGRWVENPIGPKRHRSHYDPPWYRRWHPGQGKFYKKMAHRATRQALKAILRGSKPRRSYRYCNSICNWKGH